MKQVIFQENFDSPEVFTNIEYTEQSNSVIWYS